MPAPNEGSSNRDPVDEPLSVAARSEVADLKLAEEHLRRADQYLSFHVNNTPLAVIEWDQEFRVARWTGQAEKLFGWTADEVLGKKPYEWRLVHEADLPLVRGIVQDMIRLRNTSNVQINRNYTKTGATIWCEWHNSVLLSETGATLSTMSVVLDITDRKIAEEALLSSEARFKSALNSARMMGWEWDLVGHRGYYSSDCAAFFALPPDKDYSLPEEISLAIHPDDYPAVADAWQRAIEKGDELFYEHRMRGQERWFSTRGQLLRNPEGLPIRMVGVTTDITERKHAESVRSAQERQMLDAQKRESLGILAGGVAHDFNNILTVILGCAGLARKGMSEAYPAAGYLDQIEKASRRAADLCRQLLAYSGRGSVAVGRFDLNRIIQDSAKLIEVPAAKRSRVSFELAPATPMIHADPTQIRQVILNLVMNAAEAIGQASGEIRVRTSLTEIGGGAPESGYRIVPLPGRYARVDVSDTGTGISPEIQSRIFDPFFSTKFAGRGLGLAAVLGIMQAHHGAIRVESTVGQGTTISILWPVTPAASPAAAAVNRPIATPGPPTRNSGAALIVDDDMYVREVAASTVKDLGFEPLLAGDGPTGMELFRQRRESIRVAIVDVVMPGMSGEEMLRALHDLDPRLPVLLISGFTERRLEALGDRTGKQVEFLQKPFHPEELIMTIEQMLVKSGSE